MNPLAQTISEQRAAIRRTFARPTGWFIALMAAWWLLLALFYLVPQIDLSVARGFFEQAVCGQAVDQGGTCGSFPYGGEAVFIAIRRVLFYLPGVVAIGVLVLLIGNLKQAGATYRPRLTRDYSIALVAFLAGPLVLVNLFLKELSNRPRPYETDVFGGKFLFMPAGNFHGSCTSNCSFISGEAAGSGWLACMIVLLPKPLRPVLGPPLIAISLVSPALRISFGGHYLSDVTLGWLSSLVVYAAVAACFEMSQRARKRNSPTIL